MEMSGPVTATRGAAVLLRAASRTWKFQNGPPTSATLVTPLASQTRKVCGSRAWLRCTSDAYGRHAPKSAASGRVYRLPDWKKCTCESIRPGMTHLPWPSITRAPRGTFVVAAGPTALMRLPAMITVLSAELAAAPSSSGCTTVAPTMAVRAPSAALAARGAASDTTAAAPQSAEASTSRQQRNRDMDAAPKDNAAANCSARPPGNTRISRHRARVIQRRRQRLAPLHRLAGPFPVRPLAWCRCDRPAPESREHHRVAQESRRTHHGGPSNGARHSRFDASDRFQSAGTLTFS